MVRPSPSPCLRRSLRELSEGQTMPHGECRLKAFDCIPTDLLVAASISPPGGAAVDRYFIVEESFTID
ncbi:MAG: hypothetical protein VX589_07695 [Myxococcota bacterium]|nr:hypothetical protein [Myxococcota bacterium]